MKSLNAGQYVLADTRINPLAQVDPFESQRIIEDRVQQMTPVSEEPLPRNELAGDQSMTDETSDAIGSRLMAQATANDTEASMTTAPDLEDGMLATAKSRKDAPAIGVTSEISGYKTEGKPIAIASQLMDAPKKKFRFWSQLTSSQNPAQIFSQIPP